MKAGIAKQQQEERLFPGFNSPACFPSQEDIKQMKGGFYYDE